MGLHSSLQPERHGQADPSVARGTRYTPCALVLVPAVDACLREASEALNALTRAWDATCRPAILLPELMIRALAASACTFACAISFQRHMAAVCSAVTATT